MPSRHCLFGNQPEPTWYDTFDANRAMWMAPQSKSWTCSICAVDWTLRATGIDPYSTREKVTGELIYPTWVDEYSGLKDSQRIVDVFASFGVECALEWIDFDRAHEICSETAGLLNGVGWFHFVGIRGVTGNGTLWIANSAKGYRGVGEALNRQQFNALGPFRVARLVR